MVEDDYADPVEVPTDQIASRIVAIAALVKELKGLPEESRAMKECIELMQVVRKGLKTLPQGGDNLTTITGGKVVNVEK